MMVLEVKPHLRNPWWTKAKVDSRWQVGGRWQVDPGPRQGWTQAELDPGKGQTRGEFSDDALKACVNKGCNFYQTRFNLSLQKVTKLSVWQAQYYYCELVVICVLNKTSHDQSLRGLWGLEQWACFGKLGQERDGHTWVESDTSLAISTKLHHQLYTVY